jgi:hypothetical protein
MMAQDDGGGQNGEAISNDKVFHLQRVHSGEERR